MFVKERDVRLENDVITSILIFILFIPVPFESQCFIRGEVTKKKRPLKLLESNELQYFMLGPE